jgi:hypothetical protein
LQLLQPNCKLQAVRFVKILCREIPMAAKQFADNRYEQEPDGLTLLVKVVKSALHELISEVLEQRQKVIDWPAGRVALSEEEAAAACGVGRHVLRDLRLEGKITGRRLGRRVVYLHNDLLNLLVDIEDSTPSEIAFGASHVSSRIEKIR